VGTGNNNFLYPKLNSFLLENGYDVSAQQLSSLFHTCPRHFNRLLKAQIGLSMQEFITTHRITRVLRYLLKNPGCRLIKVAYDFDFSDQSHFSNNFRRIMGVSPKRYLRLFEKDLRQSIYNWDDHTFGTGVLVEKSVANSRLIAH